MYLPLYCGGRFLYGLHNSPFHNDKTLMKNIMTRNSNSQPLITSFPQDPRSQAYPGTLISWDPKITTISGIHPYVPTALENFQKILKWLLVPNSGYVGTLIAVTNSNQKLAAKHLEATGFKAVVKTHKLSGSDKSYIDTYGCITWIGDYHKDVKPHLAKVQDITLESVDRM